MISLQIPDVTVQMAEYRRECMMMDQYKIYKAENENMVQVML